MQYQSSIEQVVGVCCNTTYSVVSAITDDKQPSGNQIGTIHDGMTE